MKPAVMWRYCSVNACGIRNGIEKKSCGMRPQEEELGAGLIQSPCFVTPFSGFGKADFWVLAKGKSLLVAVETVEEPPELSPGR